MKILVTGATGFTGSHFVVTAQRNGLTVVDLQADLTDKQAVREEVFGQRPNAVLHLGGLSFVGHADDAAFYAVNVVGTMNLLEALAQLPQPPQKVLLASSANVYGNCICSPISELQATAPLNHYAMSKLAMEFMARNYYDHLPIVIARPFNYTGVGHNINFVIPKLVDHFAMRKFRISLGNLHVEREFNDVHMVCSAYLHLLSVGIPGETYNVCTGQPYTLQQVIDILVHLTGHKIHIDIDPALVRTNELHRLCGDSSKLNCLLGQFGLRLRALSLYDMLQHMLSAANKI